MTTPAPAASEHIGDTRAMANHDHDLVHELSNQLDAVWRYDQYIANAGDKQSLVDFWEKRKQQSESAVDELRELIRTEMQRECF